MRDFPSCFGENGVQVADSSSSRTTKIAQNLVSCVYQCKSKGRMCLITVTWTKNLMGQGLVIEIEDAAASQCLCKVEIKPWLFSKRKGCRNLEADATKIDIFWDLTSAKFGPGPEPLEKFSVAVMFNQETVLFLGDLKREAFNAKSNAKAAFVAKREHIFGKKVYAAKAQFCGEGHSHDVTIECDTATVGLHEPYLAIAVDGKTVIQVRRLNWKFRGNHAIFVDGMRVELFWDVHNWLFGNAMGNAVFMFQTCLDSDGKLSKSPPVFDQSVLSWSSSSRQLRENQWQGLGFSLVLHAWKNE